MRTVPPFGPEDAELVIVGEAPGREELRAGRPFVGPAGRLLRQLLQEVGYNPDQVYYTNVVKYLPKQITPTAGDLREARPQLFAELAALPNVQVIVPVGNIAVKALTGLTGVTALRGTLLPPLKDLGAQLKHPVHILPTLHPAYVLRGRNPQGRAQLKQDLAIAVRLLKEDTPAPPFSTIIHNDAAELESLVTSKPLHYVGVDIETNGLRWWEPGFEILVVGVSVANHSAYVYMAEPVQGFLFTGETGIKTFIPVFLKMLRHGGGVKQLSLHNARFDICGLLGWGLKQGVIVWEDIEQALLDPQVLQDDKLRDSMLDAYLSDPLDKKSLEYLVQVRLGEPPYKLDFKRKDISLGELGETCLQDALYTSRLSSLPPDKRFASSYLSLRHTRVLETLCQLLMVPALRALACMELRGLLVDQEKLGSLLEEHKARQEELEETFRSVAQSHGLENFNPRSGIQMGQLLFDCEGLKPVGTTATGRYSLDKAARQLLLEQYPDNPLIKLYSEYQLVRQRVGTFLEPWSRIVQQTGGRLHPGYKLAHVKSGRLSSEAPNIQQVPKEFRPVVRAEPGYLFINADYSQLELRVAAWLAGEERLLEAFWAGEDVHLATAKLVLGSDSAEARQVGKILNFSLLYGAGAGKLAKIAYTQYGMKLPQEEAASLREQFFQTYPKLREWQVDTIRLARAARATSSLLGRIRPLPEYLTGDPAQIAHADHVALNHPVQSLASDLTLASLVTVSYDTTCDYYPAVTVHDSLTVAARKDQAEKAAEQVEHVMTKVAPKVLQGFHENLVFYVQGRGPVKDFSALPLAVDVVIGETWV
jgi:DNA polymerase-1